MSCLLAARTIASRISTNRRSCTTALAVVRNDPKREKFIIDLGKHNEAYLKYSEDRKSNVISLEHTFVPDAGKGMGLGKRLAQAAFQYAIDKQLMIKLECDFTVKYFKDNESKYKAYVTK
uniref:Protein NATD1 n=1 Tax=Anopheles christyi TaxID=43041 RepID=A0A182KE04_9DIPT